MNKLGPLAAVGLLSIVACGRNTDVKVAAPAEEAAVPQAVFVVDGKAMGYVPGREAPAISAVTDAGATGDATTLSGIPASRTELATDGSTLYFASVEASDDGKSTDFNFYETTASSNRATTVALTSLPRPPEDSDGVRIAGVGGGQAWIAVPGGIWQVDLKDGTKVPIEQPDGMYPCALGGKLYGTKGEVPSQNPDGTRNLKQEIFLWDGKAWSGVGQSFTGVAPAFGTLYCTDSGLVGVDGKTHAVYLRWSPEGGWDATRHEPPTASTTEYQSPSGRVLLLAEDGTVFVLKDGAWAETGLRVPTHSSSIPPEFVADATDSAGAACATFDTITPSDDPKKPPTHDRVSECVAK